MAHCVSNSGAKLLAADSERLEEVKPFLEGFEELKGVLLMVPRRLKFRRGGELEKTYEGRMEVPQAEVHQDDLWVFWTGCVPFARAPDNFF